MFYFVLSLCTYFARCHQLSRTLPAFVCGYNLYRDVLHFDSGVLWCATNHQNRILWGLVVSNGGVPPYCFLPSDSICHSCTRGCPLDRCLGPESFTPECLYFNITDILFFPSASVKKRSTAKDLAPHPFTIFSGATRWFSSCPNRISEQSISKVMEGFKHAELLC